MSEDHPNVPAYFALFHRYHWHYAPPIGPILPGYDYQLWCKWCGFRMTVPNPNSPNPIQDQKVGLSDDK